MERGATADLILDAAEKRVRRSGYNAVSFRDLAEDVSVKSASVHYHFEIKEDLGVALIKRYSDRFMSALELKTGLSPVQSVEAFCALYRQSLMQSDAICLCGMLGAEISGLPEPVAAAVREFFHANIAWLEKALSGRDGNVSAYEEAAAIVATLQGVMMLSIALRNTQIFDTSVVRLLMSYHR
ncbi:MAG: TetR/AcrR family transcriptional regulator [Hyphomicrobiales bacterium]|nr:TetR/AcrR family transcriptional regulator [Hyphomicrobiales bacterium]